MYIYIECYITGVEMETISKPLKTSNIIVFYYGRRGMKGFQGGGGREEKKGPGDLEEGVPSVT